MKKVLLTIALAGLTPGSTAPIKCDELPYIGANALINASLTAAIERYVKLSKKASATPEVACAALTGLLSPLLGIISTSTVKSNNQVFAFALTFLVVEYLGLYKTEICNLGTAIARKEFKKHMTTGWNKRLALALFLKSLIPSGKVLTVYLLTKK